MKNISRILKYTLLYGQSVIRVPGKTVRNMRTEKVKWVA